MEKCKISVILFDIDGTLVLLPIDWRNIITKINSLSGVSTKTFLGFVSKYYGTKEFWYIHKYLEHIEYNAVDSMIVLDEADRILRSLCKYIAIGFVTMQSRTAAEKIVHKMSLNNCSKFLGVLATREDARNRVEQITKIIKTNGFDPSELLFIGDKILDGIAAFVNKVNAIIVLRNPRVLQISDTDYVDEDLEAINIPIARNLIEAIKIAKNLYNIPIQFD